ncbi:ABC transporter permease [Prauserella muralis]|uniref:ABC transporter permease n=1 Tax=Prauserella muralis TaxID=588067 RepID=A0A2V4AVI5_9PSEU|nr:ABC transporter permease [Prauserella muralis]PXY24664.1 ABC transporter permease [Prauserella muralis]TWE27645.1 osmoprotectant transport system permease protein [Prauserella muralis]
MSFAEYLEFNWDDLLTMAAEHLAVVVVALALAVLIGVSVGMLTWQSPRWSGVALAASGGLLTIPSLALLALLIPVLGLGWVPSVTALVLYSLLPIVRNTVAGLRAVDPAILEAADGMGLSRTGAMWRVQLPMAWPVIITGIRVSAQLLFAIATIAAYVAGPGFGHEIFAGLARLGAANALNQAIAGTLGVVALALVFDAAFIVIRRLTTSRGLRV